MTLVTGDAVRLTPAPGGRSVVSVTPSKPSRGFHVSSFTDTFKIGGDVYAVPGEALPFLGSVLDPRLFDVSYLQRAGYTGLNTLPVSITWRHPAHSAIPGVAAPTVGSQTTGSISMATARALGQALASSRRPGEGVLADVKKISLRPLPGTGTQTSPAERGAPGAQAPATAPAVPLQSKSAPAGTRLYTLTINALDTSGQPAYAEIAVQNLQSFQRYYSVQFVAPGQPLTISVPAGPYGVEGFVFATPFEGNLALVSMPQVDVSSDTAVTLDARQAKPVTVTVPDNQATTEDAAMTFTRLSADHNGLQGLWFAEGPGISSSFPPVHLYATPTAPPRIGSLGFSDSWALGPPGTDGVNAPYAYNLDFASADGVPAGLSHTLTPADLATVHDSFASSVTGSVVQSAAVPFHPWSTLAFALFPSSNGFPAPTQRTDYFIGSAPTVWQQEAGFAAQGSPEQVIFGPYRTFRPGEDLSTTWGASPAVPAPEWQNIGLTPGSAQSNGFSPGTWSYICPVCRQGDVMSFNIPASGDNDRTHSEVGGGLGSGILASTTGPPTDSVKFYRNGVLTQVAGSSGQVFPLVPGKASYEIDWASTIPAQWTRLATSVDSVWKFTSTGPASADKLPRYELCSPDITQPCSFMPLVFASYDFGADLQGQVHAPGPETFTLTGYHEAGDNGPPVTGASVQVSFDDGQTWSPAAVTSLGGGRFKVTFTQPDPSATSGYASVKVSLSDAGGDTLQQTILRAYALTSAAAATAPSPAPSGSK